jgi:hypothetical protein
MFMFLQLVRVADVGAVALVRKAVGVDQVFTAVDDLDINFQPFARHEFSITAIVTACND